MTTEVAIIAGVGPGTGGALARAFANQGYAVGLLSRRAESSAPIAEEIEHGGAKGLARPSMVLFAKACKPPSEKLVASLA